MPSRAMFTIYNKYYYTVVDHDVKILDDLLKGSTKKETTILLVIKPDHLIIEWKKEFNRNKIIFKKKIK